MPIPCWSKAKLDACQPPALASGRHLWLYVRFTPAEISLQHLFISLPCPTIARSARLHCGRYVDTTQARRCSSRGLPPCSSRSSTGLFAWHTRRLPWPSWPDTMTSFPVTTARLTPMWRACWPRLVKRVSTSWLTAPYRLPFVWVGSWISKGHARNPRHWITSSALRVRIRSSKPTSVRGITTLTCPRSSSVMCWKTRVGTPRIPHINRRSLKGALKACSTSSKP